MCFHALCQPCFEDDFTLMYVFNVRKLCSLLRLTFEASCCCSVNILPCVIRGNHDACNHQRNRHSSCRVKSYSISVGLRVLKKNFRMIYFNHFRIWTRISDLEHIIVCIPVMTARATFRRAVQVWRAATTGTTGVNGLGSAIFLLADSESEMPHILSATPFGLSACPTRKSMTQNSQAQPCHLRAPK